MNLVKLFTTFTGRINRKGWWIGFIILTAVELGLVALVDPSYFDVPEPVEDPTVTEPALADSPPQPNFAHLLVVLLICIPALAVTIKRFNDRNYVWWIGYAVYTPAVLYYIAVYLGFFVVERENYTPIEHLLFWPFALIGLFVLIDNGFMRGTRGPNRYGPDPNIDAEFETA